MIGLRLKLGPNEQVLINGAVVQNGQSKAELRIKTPNTKILRLRDAIHPTDVDTPTKRVCYIAQLAVAGEVAEDTALAEFCAGVSALRQVFTNANSSLLMEEAVALAAEGNFYKALQYMRKLLPYEALLIDGSPTAAMPDAAAS
jgi:flagellar biosynthesis repressor protein FlbT